MWVVRVCTSEVLFEVDYHILIWRHIITRSLYVSENQPNVLTTTTTTTGYHLQFATRSARLIGIIHRSPGGGRAGTCRVGVITSRNVVISVLSRAQCATDTASANALISTYRRVQITWPRSRPDPERINTQLAATKRQYYTRNCTMSNFNGES